MLRAICIALLLSLPASAAGLTGHSIDAQFSPCGSGPRITCIVDGDTFLLRGTKIRIADVNTPEVSQASCSYERALGQQATRRMQTLLNQGPFSLERTERDEDRYGRKLRIASRGGMSLGDILVREGLAEHWTGRRKNWC